MQDLIEGTYSTGHDAFHPGGDDTANNPELGADDFDADDDNHWEIDPSINHISGGKCLNEFTGIF